MYIAYFSVDECHNCIVCGWVGECEGGGGGRPNKISLYMCVHTEAHIDLVYQPYDRDVAGIIYYVMGDKVQHLFPFTISMSDASIRLARSEPKQGISRWLKN